MLIQVVLPHANTGVIFEFEEITRPTLCGIICLLLMLLASVNVFLFPHISVRPRSEPSPWDFSETQLVLFSSKRLRTGVVPKEPTLWSLLKSWMYTWLSDPYFLKLAHSRRLCAMSASDQNVRNRPTVSLHSEICLLSSLSSVSYGLNSSEELRRGKEDCQGVSIWVNRSLAHSPEWLFTVAIPLA